MRLTLGMQERPRPAHEIICILVNFLPVSSNWITTQEEMGLARLNHLPGYFYCIEDPSNQSLAAHKRSF